MFHFIQLSLANDFFLQVVPLNTNISFGASSDLLTGEPYQDTKLSARM